MPGWDIRRERLGGLGECDVQFSKSLAGLGLRHFMVRLRLLV